MKSFLAIFTMFVSLTASATVIDMNSSEMRTVKHAIGAPAQRLSGIDYNSDASFYEMAQGPGYNSVVNAANLELRKIQGYEKCFNFNSLYNFLDKRGNLNTAELAVSVKLQCNP